ncbi:L-threonylcarbamoyladenylate synthase [Crocinitomicaceae bacterium]|nr:L-threonylcarbamoyladenylate synthase [Crocinitomicaceae bacterium]
MRTKTGNNIYEAAELLNQGQLVAIPTETVYGLAANGLDDDAISKIFKVKKRPISNPLILHFKDIDSITAFVTHIPAEANKIANAFWPGPLTLLLDKTAKIPNSLNSGKQKIAVRIPNHPDTLQLLRLLDFPLAAPSANLYGRISPTKAAHVANQLSGSIPYILDGGMSSKGIESTILGFENGRTILYRLGAITTEEIEDCIGNKVIIYDHSLILDQPISSGMVKYHYAPRTPIYDEKYFSKKGNNTNVGYIGYNKTIDAVPNENQFLLSPESDLNIASKNLYHALHFMDEQKFDAIYICNFPPTGLGRSMNDRINKATAKYKK